MIRLEAVIEVPTFDDAAPWSVAPAPPQSWLALNRDCSHDQVGLFVAAVADRLDPPTGRDEIIDALLSEEMLIMAGGLRLHDTETGAVVVPGCCNGLEDWRDWLEVERGRPIPWLGHDPTPEVEFVADVVRVWQHGFESRGEGVFADRHVDLPRADLPHLLRGVHADLVGFLGALNVWSTRIGLGARGRALTEAIDHHFAITPPLHSDG